MATRDFRKSSLSMYKRNLHIARYYSSNHICPSPLADEIICNDRLRAVLPVRIDEPKISFTTGKTVLIVTLIHICNSEELNV